MTDENGYNRLRSEIFRIAQLVGAKEVWYCSEYATDAMFEGFDTPNYSLEALKMEIANKAYCFLEYDVITMREEGGMIASYMHDDFHDIVLI